MKDHLIEIGDANSANIVQNTKLKINEKDL